MNKVDCVFIRYTRLLTFFFCTSSEVERQFSELLQIKSQTELNIGSQMFGNSLILCFVVRVNLSCQWNRWSDEFSQWSFVLHCVITQEWPQDGGHWQGRRTLTEMKPSYAVWSPFRGKSSGLSFTSSMPDWYRRDFFFFCCCCCSFCFFFCRFREQEGREAGRSRQTEK